MNNHQQWYDWLPLYIAGQLSENEAQQLEQRLARDPSLYAAYLEWRMIADVVQEEATYWANPLPPLSKRVKEQLFVSQATQPNLAPSPEPTRITRMPMPHTVSSSLDGFEPTQVGLGYSERYKVTARKNLLQRLPLLGAAAAISLFFISAFLVYLVTTSEDAERKQNISLSNNVVTSTITPFVMTEVTAFPTNTSQPTFTPQSATRTPRPPATQAPSDFDTGILSFNDTGVGTGGGGDGTNNASSSSPSVPIDNICRATAKTELPVTVYTAPFGTPIQRQMYIGEYWNVVAIAQTNWYQVVRPFAPYERGWVYGFEINLSGDCSNLPEPSPTPTLTMTP
ncbi:MAG: hypothetical protein CUN55_11805 [Phototrophicales bacterium]|nr:MAG: hypothetical protein CUN55_11805 [Phototrophicales bacterium]